MQALEKARSDAAEAGAAVKAAERQLAELERGVVKARMEAKSLRERAQDLAERLTELRAATKARTLRELRPACFHPCSRLMIVACALISIP